MNKNDHIYSEKKTQKLKRFEFDGTMFEERSNFHCIHKISVKNLQKYSLFRSCDLKLSVNYLVWKILFAEVENLKIGRKFFYEFQSD